MGALLALIGGPCGLRGQEGAMEVAPVAEVAVGYQYAHANAALVGCGCSGLQGGSVSVAFRLKEHISFAGAFTDTRASSPDMPRQSFTLTTFTVGPRVTMRRARWLTFGQALVGQASGSGGMPAASVGNTTSFAVDLGGGVDVELPHHLAVRALDVQYVHTGFANGAKGAESFVTAGVGVVLRVGGRGATRETVASVPEPVVPAVAMTAPLPVGKPVVGAAGEAVSPVAEILEAEVSPEVQVKSDVSAEPVGAGAVISAAPAEVAMAAGVEPGMEAAAAPQGDLQDPQDPQREAEFHERVRDVLFDYDSAALRPEMRKAVVAAAVWLKGHPGVAVEVVGYADEPGDAEYNLALGERRADAAREALVRAGVARARVHAHSVGKEVRVCASEGPECAGENRRAAFEVVR